MAYGCRKGAASHLMVMADNYLQALGYQTYIVPLQSRYVDLATLVAADGGNYKTFVDPSSAVSGRKALLTAGQGDTFAMAFGGAAFTITNVARASNVVTITTSAAHGLTAGGLVSVEATTNTGVNGTFKVKAAPTTTTLTYDQTGSSITSAADTGTIVGGAALKLDGTDSPVRLLGLNKCSFKESSGSETILDYDSDLSGGYDKKKVTSQGFEVSIGGYTDFTEIGYKTAIAIARGAARNLLMAKILRIGPAGTTEASFGYVQLSNTDEGNDAGKVNTWSMTGMGYGPSGLKPDNRYSS